MVLQTSKQKIRKQVRYNDELKVATGNTTPASASVTAPLSRLTSKVSSHVPSGPSQDQSQLSEPILFLTGSQLQEPQCPAEDSSVKAIASDSSDDGLTDFKYKYSSKQNNLSGVRNKGHKRKSQKVHKLRPVMSDLSEGSVALVSGPISAPEAARRLSIKWPRESDNNSDPQAPHKSSQTEGAGNADKDLELKSFFADHPVLHQVAKDIQVHSNVKLETIMHSVKLAFLKSKYSDKVLIEMPYKKFRVPNWQDVETSWPGFEMKPIDNWKDFAYPNKSAPVTEDDVNKVVELAKAEKLEISFENSGSKRQQRPGINNKRLGQDFGKRKHSQQRQKISH